MRTPQAPIGSGFGAASTAAEVIAGRDLTGKTAVVTGGYSGIGVETVRAFRSAGAKVVPTDDSTELRGVRPRATDPIAAGRLWQLSEQLTGVGID
jgi:NAD(P)-dependent dehydrogenase (short-subunit alcohol dehydrogenase family)